MTDTTSTTPSPTRPELDRFDRRDAVERFGREAARQLWHEDPANAATWRARFRYANEYRPPLAGQLDLIEPSWRDTLDVTAVESRAVDLWHDERERQQRDAAAAVDAAEQQRAAAACPVCSGPSGTPLGAPHLPGAEQGDTVLCWACRVVVAHERISRLGDELVRDGVSRVQAADAWLSR